MQEYSTLALILQLEQSGEANARVTLFTEALGKVVARARSLYKSTSKLAAHIQPLTLARVRLVEKNGIQLVDAVTVRRLLTTKTAKTTGLELLGVASLISGLTHFHQPDDALWSVIERGELMSRELLRVLGFDPDHARCRECGCVRPRHFMLNDSTYLCADCFGRGGVYGRGTVEIPDAKAMV